MIAKIREIDEGRSQVTVSFLNAVKTVGETPIEEGPTCMAKSDSTASGSIRAGSRCRGGMPEPSGNRQRPKFVLELPATTCCNNVSCTSSGEWTGPA